MNKLPRLKIFAFIAWTAVSAPFLYTPVASANPVIIKDHRCVATDLAHFSAVIVDYEKYADREFSKYELDLQFGKINLLDMVKSQSKSLPNEGSASRSLVWVVMRPTNLTDSLVYPRFLLDCATVETVGQSFSQSCGLVKTKQHYALEEFQSKISARTGSVRCAKAEIDVDYEFDITGSAKEVAEIKLAVLAPAGPLAPLLEKIFNEDAFFRSYYENFIRKLIESLTH